MAEHVIGVDAGGTKLLVGVVGPELEVDRRVRRLWHGGGQEEVLGAMIEAVEEALESAPDARAIGFGIPSLVDRASGASLQSVHLPLDDVAFRDLMGERFDVPVYVDNDANLAALCEHRHGAARGADNAVLLTIGTGIGGALVLDGRIYRGGIGAAGELGHMTVDLDGPPCQGACPNRGCLEAVASGRAIGRHGEAAAEAHPDSGLGRALAQGVAITGELVTDMALDGDEVAAAVIREIGARLGAGLVGIVNVFNPEVIVIGGGASRSTDLLLDPARAVVAERALRPGRDAVHIVPARFGEEAGMLGGALFAIDGGA